MCEDCKKAVKNIEIQIEMAASGIGEYSTWTKEQKTLYCTELRAILKDHSLKVMPV